VTDQKTLSLLYISLVKPHLEHCCRIWNPYFVKDIDLNEGVQRRATKLVKGRENLHYKDRLKHLGLIHLDRRRNRGDLIETFKIISGMYDIRQELFFDFDEGGRRGHSKKLFKRRSRLDIIKFVFSNRVVNK